MRKSALFSLLLFALFYQNGFSQDTIIWKSGNKSVLFVQKITDVILYRVSDEPFEETLSMKKEDVASIHYYSGKVDNVLSASPPSREYPHYLRYGIVPYQFLSRSSALYFQNDFAKKWAVEVTLGFTYPQPGVENGLAYWTDTHGYYIYRGANNTLSFAYQPGMVVKLNLILAQRYWFYNDEWLSVDHVPTSSSYSYQQLKSSTLLGLGGGLGIAFDIGRGAVDAQIFTNILIFECFKKTTIKGAEGQSAPPPGYGGDYPQMYSSRSLQPSMAMGFRIGFRKIRKKSGTNVPEKK